MMHQLRACSARARRPGEEETAKDGEDEENHMQIDEPSTASVIVDEPHGSSTASTIIDISSIDEDSHASSSNGSTDNGSDVQVVSGPSNGGSGSNDIPRRLKTGEQEEEHGTARTTTRSRSPTSSSFVSSPMQGMRRRRRRVEVVDLVDSPEPASATIGPSANQWACPACTLHNPKSTTRCNACNTPNPERPPDPTRTERLIDDHAGGGGPASPLAMLGGGALMGGILGAAGSYLHGGDPLVSAMEGAVTGAFGGAFLNEAVASRRQQQPRPISNEVRHETWADPAGMGVAHARSSAGISGGYPSMMPGGENEQRGGGERAARPRSSFRVEQIENTDGSRTTLVMGGRSSTSIRQGNNRTPVGISDQMRMYLLHSMMEQHSTIRGSMPGLGDGLDGMTYEELLQAFGDGTENMGANTGQIDSLPTQAVTNPEKELPEDARQCLICLEDICQGETRKILPCLHGFHAFCCDRWLKTNGSCPICKHRV